MRGLVSILLSILPCVVLCTTCPGTDSCGYLCGLDIDEFRGCTQVDGNLVINSTSLDGDAATSTPPVSTEQLFYLSSIKEISGYLLIEDLNNINITNLRFLRQLEVIHGLETIQFRQGQHYSLAIMGNSYLQTLGLSSLQRIENGGVRISGNPQLCLVDTLTVEDYLVTSTLRRIGGLGMDCSAYTCHEQCSLSEGCWGTLPDECVECGNYNYLGTCVESCDLNITYANDSTKQCLPLTPLTTLPPTDASTTHSHTTSPPITTEAASSENSPASANQNLNRTELPTDTNVTTLPTNMNSKWPIFAGPITVVVALVIVSAAIAIIYCCYRTRKSRRKLSLKVEEPDSPQERTGDVEDDKKNNSGNKEPHLMRTIHESSTTHRNTTMDSAIAPVHRAIENIYVSEPHRANITSDNNPQASLFLSPSSTGSTEDHVYCTIPALISETTADAEHITNEDSPTLSRTSADQRVSYSSSTTTSSPKPSSRQSHNCLVHRPMTGGVYPTRTPPSHPHRLSAHRITPHTHRGSLTSGGSASRASTMPSRSSNNGSVGTSSSMGVRLTVTDSDNSLSEYQEHCGQLVNCEQVCK